MHADSKRNETPAPERKPSTKHKLPDPPDPDNLPIDYPGTDRDSGRYSAGTAKNLRPQREGFLRRVRP